MRYAARDLHQSGAVALEAKHHEGRGEALEEVAFALMVARDAQLLNICCFTANNVGGGGGVYIAPGTGPVHEL